MQIEKKESMVSKQWSRRSFMVVGGQAMAAAALATGCGGDKSETPKGAVKSDPAAKGTPWAKTVKIADLVDVVHLADLNHHGEFMDFGTAARFKYSLGGWMSGWDNDSVMNGVAYTWATKSPARLYFNLPNQTDITFEFRVKKGGADYFSVYLNDHPLSRVSMTKSGWGTYRVSASADTTVRGENYFKLIFNTATQQVGGQPASFAMDYIRVIPAGTDEPERFDPPYLHNLVQPQNGNGVKVPAVTVTCPTTLSYHLQIPAGASFCTLASGIADNRGKMPSATLKITAVEPDGSPKTLATEQIVGKKTSPVMVDLSAYENKLIRLDLSVAGKGASRVALTGPSIRVSHQATVPKTKFKNVVVLLVDTLRADKLKSYGNKRVKSNAMDDFIKKGTLFEQCQAASNWTKPSCATVLTGLYPDSHKARGHSSVLSKSVKMVSEIFREKGFSTGAFVANGYLAKEFGFDRGWSKYVNYIRENKNTDAENVYKDALSFIKGSGNKPFFAYVQTIDPHVPYDPPAEDLKLYDARAYEGPVSPRNTGNLLEDIKRRKIELNTRDRRHLEALYDGEVTYHDRQFGSFVKELKAAGKLDETIFVITADHGEEFFEHDSVGHGHTLYQELVHVPLAVVAPGLVPVGKRVNSWAGSVDIVPTVLAATGVGDVEGLEGHDLTPRANGVVPHPMESSFSSFFSEADGRNLQWAVWQGQWKMRMRGPVNTYLHKLDDDPGEKSDVDEQYPVALRALRIALSQFIGAPDKHRWMGAHIKTEVVGRPEAKAENNENIPEDLKQQLRQLGYMK